MKEKITNIKEMFKDPKKNALAFFGFYLLFFIIVIFFLRSVNKNYIDPDGYEMGNQMSYDSKAIINNNYSYTYEVILDDKTYQYVGDRNGNNDLFKLQ